MKVLLTVAGCPLKDTITRDVTTAVGKVPGRHRRPTSSLGVMTQEQRSGLQEILRGGQAQREIPFAQPGSLTKVYAIASGKGGVGKSSVTVNLAVAMANQGLKVGLVDADIYGHSVPAMLGIGDERPTQVEDLIMPVPTAVGRLRDLASACSSRAATRWSPGAARCSTGRWCRCSPTSTGATSTCCCSTCRPAPATWRSRSASTSPTPRWSW